VSYETVKYFNAERHEFDRYRHSICNYQNAEYYTFLCGTLLYVGQNTVLLTCLLITCFIAVYQVSSLQQPVGRFVTLLMYMAQLQGPLSFFGAFYVSIQSSLINAERMLELFKEQPTVTDSHCVSPLATCQGKIEFRDVSFSYDARNPVLTRLTFTCQPGTTTALVGESGGGKSTVLRLLFRSYNPENGKILVDGRDVQDIAIDSLRRNIGVVPQDATLFNDTLMYNLKYANTDASDEDVHQACSKAGIHDKIEGFPDGYNTKVGERGLRLSGGEKQRVAIARAILKNPKIILLDEATSALDTKTEEHIQKSLATLSNGRTTLIIAHRLSTITSADLILVLSDGQVAERGTHEELVSMEGLYARMWRKQNGEAKILEGHDKVEWGSAVHNFT
jgi:ABC-type transport system involved in Fe-S cluster assembly fused permease/ATPase subunit